MESKIFSPEAQRFILENLQGNGPSKMARLLQEELGESYTENQLKGLYSRNHLNSGCTGRFEPGHVPDNKGRKGYCPPGCKKGWFKKGHAPHNTDPIGTVLKKADGYLWKKLSDDRNVPAKKNWKQVHIMLWEEAYGPVPANHVVIFKDGNRENCVLENLMCISRADNAVLNKIGLRGKNPEYIETAVLLARIRRQRAHLEKGKKDGRT